MLALISSQRRLFAPPAAAIIRSKRAASRLHQFDVPPGGKGDAFHHGSMQVPGAMAAGKTKKLGPRIRLSRQTFAAQERQEEKLFGPWRNAFGQ